MKIVFQKEELSLVLQVIDSYGQCLKECRTYSIQEVEKYFHFWIMDMLQYKDRNVCFVDEDPEKDYIEDCREGIKD